MAGLCCKARRLATCAATLLLAAAAPGLSQTMLQPELGVGGLSEQSTWDYYHAGRFGTGLLNGRNASGDRIVALHAFYGLTLAYSQANWDSGDACRYSGDSTGEITTDFGGGTKSGPRTVYYDPDHLNILRGVVEARLDVRSWVSDAERIVETDGCAGPKVAVLRENLWRSLVDQEPMPDAEIALLPYARGAPPPLDERLFSPINADWHPFVESCMGFHRALGQVSDYITLGCVCSEHVTQEFGSPSLYQQMVANYAEAQSLGLPPAWVKRSNELCGDDAATKSERIRENFAMIAPGSPLLPAAMAGAPLEDDWRSTVNGCLNNLGKYYLDRGSFTSGVRTGQSCVCMEYAASEVGDPDLLNALMQADFEKAESNSYYGAYNQTLKGVCEYGGGNTHLLNKEVRARFDEIRIERHLNDKTPYYPK